MQSRLFDSRLFQRRGYLYQTLGIYEKSIADYTTAVESASREKDTFAIPILKNERGIGCTLSGKAKNPRGD